MRPAQLDRLPEALAGRGYDRDFFARASPRLRQTVFNLFSKLQPIGLWRFVAQEWESKDGCLHFFCPDLEGFREALAALDFTRPRGDEGNWDSRERRGLCALHVKHFSPWPANRVQVHIDIFGAVTGRRWWLFPPLPAGLAILHGLTQRSYLEAEIIQRILMRQGFDPRVHCRLDERRANE